MGLLAYQLALWFFSPLVFLFFCYQLFVSGKFRNSWRPRLGLDFPKAPQKPTIHIHAASVGEAIALVGVIKELRQRLPDWAFLVTSLSETGHQTVLDRLNPEVATFLPLDYRFLVRRLYDQYEPKLLILMETEFWPNLIEEAKSRGLAVMVANGRISPGTIRFYHTFSFLYHPLLAKIDCFAAQTEADGKRVVEIGFPKERVKVVGDVKYDQIAQNPNSPRLKELLSSINAPSKNVLAAGSTHPGEHEKLIEGFAKLSKERDDAYLILAPRHPQELDKVRRLLSESELSYLDRSKQRDEKLTWSPDIKVLLVDTMGELAFFYSLCSVAFVGGSLAKIGGHSPLEPAVFGKPVLFGPHAFNFIATNEMLVNAQGAQVVDSHEILLKTVVKLFDNEEEREEMGSKAKEAVLQKQGASMRMAELAHSFVTSTNKYETKSS